MPFQFEVAARNLTDILRIGMKILLPFCSCLEMYSSIWMHSVTNKVGGIFDHASLCSEFCFTTCECEFHLILLRFPTWNCRLFKSWQQFLTIKTKFLCLPATKASFFWRFVLHVCTFFCSSASKTNNNQLIGSKRAKIQTWFSDKEILDKNSKLRSIFLIPIKVESLMTNSKENKLSNRNSELK